MLTDFTLGYCIEGHWLKGVDVVTLLKLIEITIRFSEDEILMFCTAFIVKFEVKCKCHVLFLLRLHIASVTLRYLLTV